MFFFLPVVLSTIYTISCHRDICPPLNIIDPLFGVLKASKRNNGKMSVINSGNFCFQKSCQFR